MSAPLLIDVGNTRFKWAEIDATGEIRPRGEVETALVTDGWMSDFALPHTGRPVVVASVVPKISTLIERALPTALLVRGAWSGLPLAFDYPNPTEIGADRLAAAIGASSGAPAIIISCGTATAFSALDRRGRFCGGAILPGLHTQLRSLHLGTAQLPLASVGATVQLPGRSTDMAMRSGVLVGWRAAVVQIVTLLKRELGGMPQVIVTGGEAFNLLSVSELGLVEFRPLLVFEGLRIIADALPDR
jgi:pantothenate kinase type III